MSEITLGGNPIHTVGTLPEVGSAAPGFQLVGTDLSTIETGDLDGRRVVLNIFPSIDTPTCATSVRTFNQRAAELDNTTVLCVSADLPFAATRFCGGEGIDNLQVGSTFRGSSFGEDYGVTMIDGALNGLLARAVIVLDTDGTVLHAELVGEIADEPDYDAAIAALG